MGSASSKAARAVAGPARRQYPKTVANRQATSADPGPPPPAGQPTAPGPTVHPQSQASDTRNASINRDAVDPAFARSLRSIGPVTPAPTLSNTSAFNAPQAIHDQSSTHQSWPSIFPDPAKNPAIQVLNARSKLAEEAEEEFRQTGRKGFAGRQFLDVATIRQVFEMRDERGLDSEEIEKRLELRKGVVERLGRSGVVRDVDGIGG
ncbi:hypothetical protein MMC09_007040 [Bachmanniomyces sp. S44760]|nr:hypothetical protein [Bachmanniomyces sp. S44760]